MSSTSIQDILPLVQLPSRYLGNEINRVAKAWGQTKLHVALAFPDLYEIATSHFGIQILYGLLNAQKDILAERVYAPATDMEDQLRKRQVPLCSLESQRPLKQFDLIGFSLLYELNYTNVINMLDLAGIAVLADERHERDPFVIAGGPCTCNPEPVADIFDAIVIGDGERVLIEMTNAWKTWHRAEHPNRQTLLRCWQAIKGVYVPSLLDTPTHQDGKVRSAATQIKQRPIERAVISDLNDIPFTDTPIIPFGKPIHDRLRMEIARGCTRGCRFCQAGMIYRPVRERHPEAIVSSAAGSLADTGYEDLSLLSLSTGDYSCISPLMQSIMAFGEDKRVAVSLPSLRAGSLTPELMDLIRKVRKTGFTIAPEAGSQRLRDVINKNITEADIVSTVKNAFALGWKLVKLYFMIGLPTETQTDIEAIGDLVDRLKRTIKTQGKTGSITVSIATFVPKPHTPFQWEPQIGLDAALQKLNWLKERLRSSGVKVKWQDPHVSVVEGVWSRGDRRLTKALIQAWQSGCRFDGWSDHFNYDRWMQAFEACGINPNDYTRGYADLDRSLPWDHIHMGPERTFLKRERQRALGGKITKDCRTGACCQCGVCDFETLAPISYHNYPMVETLPTTNDSPDANGSSFTYVVDFQKMGAARFFGHLEMVKIFTRGFRRAHLPIQYSHGFHPMPKISFGDTLPMGMQSESEQLFITLKEQIDPQLLVSRMQHQLPDGLHVVDCSPKNAKNAEYQATSQLYRVELKDGFFQQTDLDWLKDQPAVLLHRKNKKGKTIRVDLKMAVVDIQLMDERRALMTLRRNNGQLVRPAQVMKTVFHLSEAFILRATITKCKQNNV